MCNTDVHERLRQARERRGLTLQTIARQSGVREQNLVLIDRGAFDELPTGLFGRNAVRHYATAVGLSADDILAELAHFLREPEDPLDGLARVRGISRRPERKASEQKTIERPVARLSRTAASVGGDAWRVRIAGVIDGALLVGVNLVLLVLTALAAGVPIAEAARVGAPALLLLFVLIFILYFVVLGGVRNATIGARLMHMSGEPDFGELLDARAALARGLRCAFRESSIIVDWLAASIPTQHYIRALGLTSEGSTVIDRFVQRPS